MKIPSIEDFDSLLQPISVDAPTGKNPRDDISSNSLYYQIKDARNLARSLERQQSQGFDTAQIKGEWEKVHKLALDIFIHIGKDIEVVAWFIESQIRLFYFAGLRDGLIFLRKLCDVYWLDLYPSADEEGFSSRIAIITGLNGLDNDGVLIGPIANIKLTAAKTRDSYALWEFQQAVEVNMISDAEKKQKRIAAGAIALNAIEASALETLPSFFRECADEIQSCLSELQLLNQILDVKCGSEAPSLTRIKNSLIHCYDAIKIIGKSAFIIEPNAETSVDFLADEKGIQNIQHKKFTFNDREKAFSLILEIANFFQESEPHSPLSYILKKAVRWGKTPLPNLIAEIIRDESVLKQFYTLTGIEDEKVAS